MAAHHTNTVVSMLLLQGLDRAPTVVARIVSGKNRQVGFTAAQKKYDHSAHPFRGLLSSKQSCTKITAQIKSSCEPNQKEQQRTLSK